MNAPAAPLSDLLTNSPWRFGGCASVRIRRRLDEKHVWLHFGTDNVGDYYPCFVFQYTPKEG